MLNIFKRKSLSIPFNNFAEYYIGAEVSASGSCKTDQDVYVDGRFHGEIITTGLVELATNSKVSADVQARTAIIQGNYQGNAKILDELHVASSADVKGSLQTSNLIVDKGAVITARIKMRQA
jgi:cytoskeletal protein CcmA (bactofilin family)